MPCLKNPQEVLALLKQKVPLIDIREPSEFEKDRIEGAQNFPLSQMAAVLPSFKGDIILTCQSGRRTGQQNYALFQKLTSGKIYILDGGMLAWNEAHLPKKIEDL